MTFAAIRMTARCTVCGVLVVLVGSAAIAQEQASRHSFRFRDTELRSALDSLMRWYGIQMVYLEHDVAGKRTSAECADCRFVDALDTILEEEGLLWKVVGGQVILQRSVLEAGSATATFAGTIRDSLTGEGVAAASVLLLVQEGQDPSGKVYRWCSTNPYGFFSLRNIRPGEYVLRVQRLGYQKLMQRIRIDSDSTVHNIAMVEQGFIHTGVTVEGQRSAFSALTSISRGLYIRATPSDHNQYLLEGARIYNPLHFGGVMSTFNGDALRDVQSIAGGVPPYYGGRIGGILDVSLRDGTEQGMAGSATVGSLGSSLLLEGPVLSTTTFVVSGRRGYPDLLFPGIASNETPSDQRSVELMGKLTHRLSDDQRLSLSAFFGRDVYNARAARVSNTLSNSLRWGNAAANLRWVGVASPALFFNASAIYTRYHVDILHRLDALGRLTETFPSNYLIEDAALRAHAEYFYDQYHTVLGGVELVRHRMDGRINEFSSQIAPMMFAGFSPWELSVYFQDQWRLVPSVQTEIGVRATSFVAEQGSFSAVDPRFSLLIELRDDLRLFSSFSSVTQFVHPYRNSGIFLFYPSLFLYPSTDQIKPSTSLQVSVGLEHVFKEDRYRFAFESYFRMTHKLHEFVYDSVMVGSLSEALLLGEGEIYGAELTLEKRLGSVVGTIRYGYSWASNRFAELNGGASFHPRFDRRHELFFMFTYSPSETWTISAVGLITANRLQFFEPTSLSEAQSAELAPTFGGTDRSSYAEPYDLNGARLPGFQRLELSVQRAFSFWGIPMYGRLRVLNGYSLVDPFIWTLQERPDPRLRWRVTFDAPPLFPLYPVLSMGVRF